MVTAQEAKKILLEQRERRRQRQESYMEAKRAQGFKRIAVLISGEAYQALEDASKAGEKSKSDILTDIILNALVTGKTHLSTDDKIDANIVPRGTIDTDAIIMQYKADGMSYQQIAERLNTENIPTKHGKKWHKGTVHNVVVRMEKAKNETKFPPDSPAG